MKLRDKFVQDGFIVIEDFISDSVLEKIKLELLQLIKMMYLQESIIELQDVDFDKGSSLDEAF